MPPRRRSETESTTSRQRPATTPEGREQQLIAQAYDLAERRIREGTASAQEITHFLKLGSSRERLEQMRLAHENELTQAKIEGMQSQKRVEELYGAALNAMRTYQGQDPLRGDDEYED